MVVVVQAPRSALSGPEDATDDLVVPGEPDTRYGRIADNPRIAVNATK
jgi:hypothetical protein